MRHVQSVCNVLGPVSLLVCVSLTLQACSQTASAPDGPDVPAEGPENTLDQSTTAKEDARTSLDAPNTASGRNDTQLLESVIKQNSAALEKIQSLYADYSWRDDRVVPEIPVVGGRVPGGRQTEEGRSKVWQKGGKFHQDFTRRRVWHDAGVTMDERFIYVQGDTCYIEYHEVPKILMVFHFDNRSSLYGPAATNTAPYPNVLDFGFGVVHGTLEEHYTTSMSRHPNYFRWTIEQKANDDKHYFKIERIADIQGEPYLAEQVLVDPDRDFLVSEYRDYRRDRTLERSMVCDSQEIQEGVWFPMKVRRFQTEWDSTLQIQVNEAHVNDEFDDSIFTLDKMDFDPANVTMTEYAPGGRTKNVKAFRNNQWLPVNVIPKGERPRPRDASELIQLGIQHERSKP